MGIDCKTLLDHRPGMSPGRGAQQKVRLLVENRHIPGAKISHLRKSIERLLELTTLQQQGRMPFEQVRFVLDGHHRYSRMIEGWLPFSGLGEHFDQRLVERDASHVRSECLPAQTLGPVESP